MIRIKLVWGIVSWSKWKRVAYGGPFLEIDDPSFIPPKESPIDPLFKPSKEHPNDHLLEP